MPPTAAPNRPQKPYFFYGHCKPTQKRPTVRVGLFSNLRTLNPEKPNQLTAYAEAPFDLQKLDPDDKINQRPPYGKDPSEKFGSLAKNLSHIARYIVDALRKYEQWSPQLAVELKSAAQGDARCLCLHSNDKGVDFTGNLRMWEEMQKDGVEPNVMAYSTLVIALCKDHHADKAYELFKEMKERIFD